MCLFLKIQNRKKAIINVKNIRKSMTTSVHSFILSHLCFLLFIVHVIYRPLFHFQFLGINSPILEEIASMNRTFTVNNRRINLIFPGVKRLLPFRFGLEVPATEVP